MKKLRIKGVPALEISEEIRTRQVIDPKAIHTFHYEIRGHDELPHVVKFSGGRSSGMLLFTLLEAGILKAERGDVVVFNNTSAEHPATYEFSKTCKRLTEEEYGIPFFWVEAQTYEDSRNGEWTRLSSYRLVQPEPYSEDNPNGYHWRGEVFEELLSWRGYVPNQFNRICTTGMKLEPTRAFLADWFGGNEETPELGHYWDESRIDNDSLYRMHQRNQGGVPRDIYLKKKEFVRARSLRRPAQRFVDFSPTAKPFSNETLDEYRFGGGINFGPDGVEYLSFVGIRYDEMHRVVKVRKRNMNNGAPEFSGYEGEHVYMPLSDMQIAKEDVGTFWRQQSWDLELDAEDNLSNCTYCFLKGSGGLQKVRTALDDNLDEKYRGTPSDLAWWVEMEKKYGRDLKGEQREIRSEKAGEFIGFFGANGQFSYQTLADTKKRDADSSDLTDGALPCECTD